jgi:hypothetical protein
MRYEIWQKWKTYERYFHFLLRKSRWRILRKRRGYLQVSDEGYEVCGNSCRANAPLTWPRAHLPQDTASDRSDTNSCICKRLSPRFLFYIKKHGTVALSSIILFLKFPVGGGDAWPSVPCRPMPLYIIRVGVVYFGSWLVFGICPNRISAGCRLPRLELCVVFSVPAGKCCKVVHDRFFSYHFQFTNHRDIWRRRVCTAHRNK